MKIWQLRFELEMFDSLVPVKSLSVEEIQSFDGRSHLKDWKPIKLERMEPEKKLKLSDAPGFGMIIFSKKAIECLKPLINNYVEVLPLECSEGEYTLINIITVLKAIDYEKSVYDTFSDGKRIMSFDKYSFLPQVVSGIPIFKITDEKIGRGFVSDEFKKVVEENKLSGFKFKLVWDSEEA